MARRRAAPGHNGTGRSAPRRTPRARWRPGCPVRQWPPGPGGGRPALDGGDGGPGGRAPSVRRPGPPPAPGGGPRRSAPWIPRRRPGGPASRAPARRHRPPPRGRGRRGPRRGRPGPGPPRRPPTGRRVGCRTGPGRPRPVPRAAPGCRAGRPMPRGRPKTGSLRDLAPWRPRSQGWLRRLAPPCAVPRCRWPPRRRPG